MSAERLLPELVADRPRLSRFDRPALSLAELLKPDGGDFVHVAAWTMLDRRASPAEHGQLLAVLKKRGKPAVLDALWQLRANAALPPIDGLAPMLREQRRAAVPLIGPLFVRLTNLIEAWPMLAAPGRFVGKIPRWIGWLRRRARRVVTRAGAGLRLPTPGRVRHKLGVGHAPPHPRLSPRAAGLYQQLCIAIDRHGDAA